jgi:adenylate cyclase
MRVGEDKKLSKPKIVSHTHFVSFLNELKERKVLRVAIAYIVVTWIVIQVGESTFEALKLPDWSNSLMVVFIMLGFPFALILAWAYELTPDGLVEDKDGQSGNRSSLQNSRNETARVNGKSPSPSIAVLQFEDMSFEQNQAYFCEGIAEEILCALNDVDGLHVAARLSSFQYGSKSADIPEIGRKLNVSVVLEGSVRKSGDQIRITIQLINTTDGYQFWAGQYNHDLKDIFDVQEQIAQAVVSAMRLSIGDNLLTRPITGSTEAYDLYLKGNSYFTRPDKQNIIFARKMFEQAVGVDPDFGRAWAKLASTYAYEFLCSKPSARARREARRISRKALRLAPGIPETHIARGIAYSIYQDFKQADLEFQIAVDLDPSSFSAWFTWARSKTYEGDVRKAIEFYQNAAEIRPENYRCDLIQMTMLASLGDEEGTEKKAREGLGKAREFLKVNPDETRAWNLGAFALFRLGKVEEAEIWMNTSLANSPTNSELTYNAACFYSLAGDTKKSLEFLAQAADSGCLNLTWLEQDYDLEHIRDNPRFIEIVEQFKAA